MIREIPIVQNIELWRNGRCVCVWEETFQVQLQAEVRQWNRQFVRWVGATTCCPPGTDLLSPSSIPVALPQAAGRAFYYFLFNRNGPPSLEGKWKVSDKRETESRFTHAECLINITEDILYIYIYIFIKS